MTLKPYLRTLKRAIVKAAPPWPKGAHGYPGDLLGWYDGSDDDGRALIYINLDDPDHQNPNEILHTLSEECAHHVRNDLNDPAAKALAVSLLGYSRWRAAVAERLIALLLSRC